VFRKVIFLRDVQVGVPHAGWSLGCWIGTPFIGRRATQSSEVPSFEGVGVDEDHAPVDSGATTLKTA
jgi:hypothetical protein